MKTTYIERSAGECRDGSWVEGLDLEGVGRVVVGTGPGSFAGIRSALAFAQGYALATGCEVLGLPSACAVAAKVYREISPSDATRLPRLAVVGDARQGKAWVALFGGYRLERDVFQVDQDELARAVSADCLVVTPDERRIGALLRGAFGERCLGGRVPTNEDLARFAEANPSALKPEPLPIYLNPPVRT